MEGLLLPLLLMLVLAVPLIMGTRKQKKAMAQQQELQSSLGPGDRVMTTSGMYATVADATDESTIDLEIADGVVTTWLRQAIRERIDPVAADDVEDEDSADEDAADESATVTSDSESESVTTAQVAEPLEHKK
ncbi:MULTISPECIES: preprotein translocase subunit YajC [Prauserella salsuginis group]|uniref:Preprotein translocase subunit YajC n=2 Tax=Prauserella salsuginis group TaxID=2893672 RepID=A0A839Y1B6_9PSEU|nr:MULTISPECIES: preprotein translocase subunit YajC [Prauserella salsuginis group]MBB3665725.1 preprotein translocase subunit YajC [Prauserella sediminis]MCR3723103.1 preprotein translocase subunit YajC [Prauserella flava]MCR3732522.1 preprotein translocase subunit YajC [Prauserella salsuginis]